MGYYTSNNGQIKNFTPDDTDTEFYLLYTARLSEILDAIKEKWGDIDMNQIMITPEHIHTHCIGYDLHDPVDWTDCLRISKDL